MCRSKIIHINSNNICDKLMWEFLTDTTEWWSVSCVLVKWLAGKIDMTTAHNYVDGRPCQLEQSTFAYDAVKEAINIEKKTKWYFHSLIKFVHKFKLGGQDTEFI